ncbi:MAG: UvrD-helicase domain-containing protein, partial [Armatimonadota bacterium]
MVYGGDHLVDLNPEQETAVQEFSRDFVLAAAAGSGKTRVLTERFVRAVTTAGRDAFTSTLAITFTEKAAGELWQRVRNGVAQASGYEMAAHTDLAWISTIHSMCSRLLRRHALEVGLDPRFVIGSPV